jgi:hypothetical protein
MRLTRRWLIAAAAALLCAGGAHAQPPAETTSAFTIAVIPDTQHYLDYRKQTAAGFPFDAVEMFYDQMRFIAANSVGEGGDIVFATAVGDVWEHQTKPIDPGSLKAGIRAVDNPALAGVLEVTDRTRTVEMPAARRGYAMLDGKLPFSVAPGNHDYDSQFTDAKHPPGKSADPYGGVGMLFSGGLDNFREVFGAQTPFFKDKPWYVGSFNGGADSAQVFDAGGYRFLHIGLEMAPADDVLAWAAEVVKAHPGLPTIVSIHDHLDSRGQRAPNPVVDWKKVDPRRNNAEDLWRKFVSKHDQVFLVVSGHHRGQSFRVDANDAGNPVYQAMADYQDRMQTYRTVTGEPHGVKTPPSGRNAVGDGWLRLLKFALQDDAAIIHVQTYSTYYKAYSTQIPQYAAWYKIDDAPDMSDADYLRKDDFQISIPDFGKRFAAGRLP